MPWCEVVTGMPPNTAMLEVREDRIPGLRILRRADTPVDRIVAALAEPGELLKRSHKSETARVGGWVIKRSVGPAPVQLAKLSLFRSRYRRGWTAACHLFASGVPAPAPVAFVEYTRAGFIRGNALITEFIDGCVDVEAHLDQMLASGAPPAAIHGYLARLAEAVNALADCGAHHTDIAGKNILTRLGQLFFFVDLDGIIVTGVPDRRRERREMRPSIDLYPGHDPAVATVDNLEQLSPPARILMRTLKHIDLRSIRREHKKARFRQMTNHVQLYDSFVDRLNDDYLAPFIRAMLPNDEAVGPWMREIHARQRKRRARTEAIWRAQGRL